MNQESLFYESLYGALADIVRVAGGAKHVGGLLWPEKTPDAAGRQLLDCLNDDRPAKLSPEQVLFLLRLGREKGCHAAMNYLARETGYSDPVPLEPEDERTRVQREFIEAQRNMARLAERMERAGLLRAA